MKTAYTRHSLAVNRQGPYVPAWFKAAIRAIDPNLVVQFTPPDDGSGTGIDPRHFPYGCVDVCKRTRFTGVLSPVVTWSLADLDGNYSPPTRWTVKMIRRAYRLHKQKNMAAMERARDQSLKDMRMAVCANSLSAFRESIRKFIVNHFGRQWTNRVFLRAPAAGA